MLVRKKIRGNNIKTVFVSVNQNTWARAGARHQRRRWRGRAASASFGG